MEQPRQTVKSFDISKRLVFEAWEKVRANGGAPGVDAVSITKFERIGENNLYKLWNRMSAGRYMPGLVRGVEIPKDHVKGVRLLGVLNALHRTVAESPHADAGWVSRGTREGALQAYAVAGPGVDGGAR